MNALLKVIRCVLFLPVGILAGQLTAAIFLASTLLLFAWSSPLSGLALLVAGVLQPVVGSVVGLWIAPTGSPWCRKVLKAIVWLVWACTMVLIVRLLLGQIPAEKLPITLPSLSAWWCVLLHSIGFVYGCSFVCSPEFGAHNATATAPSPSRPNPLCPVPSPFRWHAAN